MEKENRIQDEFRFGLKRRIYNWNMRMARERLGLRQKELGERVGISKGLISNIETLRQYPQDGLADRIATVLGLAVDSLFPEWLKEFKLARVPSTTEEEHISLQDVARLGLLEHPALLIEGPEEQFPTAEVGQKIDEVLATLKPREEKVIRLRYGLYDKIDGQYCGRSMTQEEVGREFKLTRTRIFQIEAKALRKLRHPTRSKKLKDYCYW